MKGKIFNAQEVQAIIAGNKTMFREVVKKPPHEIIEDCVYKGQILEEDSKPIKGFQAYFLKPKTKWLDENKPTRVVIKCPYQVGQKIFCKERFFVSNYIELRYEANLSIDEKYYWLPAIRMKQEHSRITLEITNIKVERLQDISEEDTRLEGIVDNGCLTCGKEEFIFQWNLTHKKPEEKFEANPWVFVYEFEIINNLN